MRVVVITQPDPVITIDEAKRHLKQDSDDDADLIKSYVAMATAHIDGPDGWLGRSIGVQTLEAYTDVFRDAMRLPCGPIVDIVSVTHLDAAGSAVTLLPSSYEVRGWLIGSAFGKRWPSVAAHPEAVRIRYRAGYEVVPPAIKAAILLMTGDLYRNRSTVSDRAATSVPMSTTVDTLLSSFRVYC